VVRRAAPERLLEVNCPFFILGANWATTCPQPWKGAGGSTVFGPQGVIVKSALGGEGFVGKAAVVHATVPTQRAKLMPKVGPLDLDAYARWSREQPGTDYWSAGVGSHSFAREMQALDKDRELGEEERVEQSPADPFAELLQARSPWQPTRPLRDAVPPPA